MKRSRWPATSVAVFAVVVTAGSCGSPDARPNRATSAAPSLPQVSEEPAVLMPELVGLASEVAFSRLARLKGRHGLNLGLTWARPVLVGCDVRPGTVARQRPQPGTRLEQRTEVVIRTAELDLGSFRGPCEPVDGDLGPVTGSDAALARDFYRFAADPSVGAPFADADVWVGIEDWPEGLSLGPSVLSDLSAWELHTPYAERSGPFSALDLMARTAGYFEVHQGIQGCYTSNHTPAALAGTRAITLSAPADTVGACMEWWGVTLFLDADDLIRGVSLRLGSP